MIDYIEIENYKSIRKMHLEMKPINILIGSNGVGKSNFISFFRFLRNIYEQNLKNYTAEEGGTEDLLYFGSKTSGFLGGNIVFIIDDMLKNGYSFRLKPNKDERFFFEIDVATFFDKNCPVNPTKSLIGSGYLESQLKDSRFGIPSDVKNYMESFQIFHFHDTSQSSKMRKSVNIADNSFLREDASNLSAFLYYLQEKHPKILKKIETVLRSVAPYFGCFNLSPDRINEDMIRLEWKEKGSDMYFNAKHLSDGTLRFIALATLLLQPNTPEVIIIDEPELGLHPFAISKLAGLIKKTSIKTQIIVSTQSVNLVDNFEPEDIITVDRKDDQSVFSRQNSEELKEWLNEYSLSDLWNKNVIGGRP